MITAWDAASALPWNFLDAIHQGAARPVLGLAIADASEQVSSDAGDLVLAVGFSDVEELLGRLDQTPAAGVVVRRAWADSVELRGACEAADLTLLSLAEGATWSVTAGVLRTIIDASASGQGWPNAPDQVYADLFGMADIVSSIVMAPVTIEDANSRIVAYSTGQEDVDEARMASIFGRQVPQRIRDHFRSLGVIRRLSRTDEPFYVPADGGIRGRYIIPVHVGHEWLGSVWALTDAAAPVERDRELHSATELIALHLLRMRAQGTMAQQAQADRLRGALRGGSALPDAGEGPWRVAVLQGPDEVVELEARRELWVAVARRSGWRQPLITDYGERVYAVLRADGEEPGTLPWVSALVGAERDNQAMIAITVGGPVDSFEDLAASRLTAEELDRLEGCDVPVTTLEGAWARLTLARAVEGLAPHPAISPLHGYLERDGDPEGTDVDTLEAVIDHWGEPKRAARQLGVHPNTVRYRLTRLTSAIEVNLEDAAQRLALRLEIAAIRSGDPDQGSAERVDSP